MAKSVNTPLINTVRYFLKNSWIQTFHETPVDVREFFYKSYNACSWDVFLLKTLAHIDYNYVLAQGQSSDGSDVFISAPVALHSMFDSRHSSRDSQLIRLTSLTAVVKYHQSTAQLEKFQGFCFVWSYRMSFLLLG